MEHKHAEFLRAIANGESPDDWQYRLQGWEAGKYHLPRGYMEDIIFYPENCDVRRKQKTHIVNGFTVPAPVSVALAQNKVYFMVDLDSVNFFSESFWESDGFDKMRFDRGIIHETKEAAIANAKAMLGIDPTE